MKRRATALPTRPVAVDTETACRLLAKQFAARRAMWQAYIERRVPQRSNHT